MNPHHPDKRQSDAGFTLIESLVAMVVLALGAISLLTAAEGHISRISEVTSRNAARWAADYTLSAAQLGLDVPSLSIYGYDFDIRQTLSGTTDPDLSALEIQVIAPETQQVLFLLDGYVATRKGP